MPLVTLTDISLAYGTDQIFDDINLSIEAGERLAFTGRNGAGKSTLLGVISGMVSTDSGSVWRSENLRFVSLSQSLPERGNLSVYDGVSSVFADIGSALADYHKLSRDLDAANTDKLAEIQSRLDHVDGWNISHRIEATLDRLKLNPELTLSELSGGWLKRVAIAQSLVQEPDVWILDEPTNHLDIEGIEWLEGVLKDYAGTVLFVSHDREMMQSVASSIIEIDRGQVTRHNCDYHTFLERRDKALLVEETHNKQFDDKLKKEESWIRQGIKARRTRNEGRVRALKALREERSKRLPTRELKLQVDRGIASGKVVKELSGLSKSLGQGRLIHDLDLIIQRGDRIGILGPNGCGKSTLLKLLLGELEPDQGNVKTGTKLQVAYFDQVRAQLNQQQSVFEYVADGRDYIQVNDKDLHVVSYLQNFMFNPDQARAPIHTLSGGEQNRLLLAKLFALPANLLVLDEPTNDLDIETLELLEAILVDYDGTVLLVSHDRTFMDNVVSSLLVFEGNGRVQEYVGGYTDWSLTRRQTEATSTASNESGPGESDFELRKKQKAAARKRARELEKVTDQIEQTEQQLAELSDQMADPEFFSTPAKDQAVVYDKSAVLEQQLMQLMETWERLEAETEN